MMLKHWHWPTPNGFPPLAITSVIIGSFILLMLSAPLVEISFAHVIDGWTPLCEFLSHLWISPDWGYLESLGSKMLETVEMTLLATAIATVVSVPLGILAAENAQMNGYITEKIINVFSSGAIPIYIGDHNYAKKIFNPNSFICVNDFDNYEDCIKYIINLTDEELTNYFNQPIFTNEKESEIFREIYNKNSNINKEIINNIKKLINI